jgi:hypothetical protein
LLLSIVGPKCLSVAGGGLAAGARHYQASGFLDRTVKPGGSFPVPRAAFAYSLHQLGGSDDMRKNPRDRSLGAVKRDYLSQLAREWYRLDTITPLIFAALRRGG